MLVVDWNKIRRGSYSPCKIYPVNQATRPAPFLHTSATQPSQSIPNRNKRAPKHAGRPNKVTSRILLPLRLNLDHRKQKQEASLSLGKRPKSDHLPLLEHRVEVCSTPPGPRGSFCDAARTNRLRSSSYAPQGGPSQLNLPPRQSLRGDSPFA